MPSADGANAPAVRGHPSHNHAEIRRTVEATAERTEVLADRPARSANKAEWEELARGLEINTDGMTKDEIIDAVEAAASGGSDRPGPETISTGVEPTP